MGYVNNNEKDLITHAKSIEDIEFRDYGLHEEISVKDINKRLNKAPKLKRGKIDFEKYPVDKAKDNFIKFVKDELIHERS